MQVKAYSGNIPDLINKLSQEIVDVLTAAGIQPHGLNLIALVNIAAKQWYDEQNGAGAETMPTFRTLLQLFVKISTNSSWNEEESAQFTTDFARVVKAMGGHVTSKNEPAPFMAPASNYVH